jgi:hypothetical protein
MASTGRSLEHSVAPCLDFASFTKNTIPKEIREQLESVAEFAKIMEHQNGKKTEGDKQKEVKQEQEQKSDSDGEKVAID